MSEPWYRDGLRFTCTRCGHCCTGDPGFVWINDEELAAIAEFRGESVEQTRSVYTRLTDRGRTLREKLNGDCVFFTKETGCTIYPVRPRQCRTWPFWESNVATPEDWEETCQICPGSKSETGHEADQGELISAEEITMRLKVIRL